MRKNPCVESVRSGGALPPDQCRVRIIHRHQDATPGRGRRGGGGGVGVERASRERRRRDTRLLSGLSPWKESKKMVGESPSSFSSASPPGSGLLHGVQQQQQQPPRGDSQRHGGASESAGLCFDVTTTVCARVCHVSPFSFQILAPLYHLLLKGGAME